MRDQRLGTGHIERRINLLKQLQEIINDPNVSAIQLIDFATKGSLVNIPRQGTVSVIYVNTAGGWIVFSG
jgi:hypothetical protein